LKKPANKKFMGKSYVLDVTHEKKFAKLVKDNNVTCILHLAAILSAAGEQNPAKCRVVNTIGFENALTVATNHKCL
jgi:nucleoside-diphosphate-sugar epimerase